MIVSNSVNHRSGTVVLEAIQEALTAAGKYNSGDGVEPAGILWTDTDGEWSPIVEKLRSLMPELLTLGDYAVEQKKGPAIWLRCVLDATIPCVEMPADRIPVLYLPHLSRQVLRSPEECPDEYKPLVELQYRGVVWTQVNGRDWTVEAFLVSNNGGLGLDVAKDQQTRDAMLRSLPALAMKPITTLQGRRLEAEDFDKMMIGDTVADLLVWMSNPEGARSEWDQAHWIAFCSRCGSEFGLDPESDGELVAAENMGKREGAWMSVWKRFAESPALYPGIPEVLRRAKPRDLLFERDAWPDENGKDEESLRKILAELSALSPDAARQRVVELDKTHGVRRSWVWAQLGQAPLAKALEHLCKVALTTVSPIGGDSPYGMAATYVKAGYGADDSALRAIAAVKSAEDRAAVAAALRAMYLPWLEDTARNFQSVIRAVPLPDSTTLKETIVSAEPSQCILLVDGLRYDVGQRLLKKAHERQFATTDGYRWAALPTVTATGKPAVTPVASEIEGGKAGEDFCPVFTYSRKPATATLLRESIGNKGYQVLHGLDAGETLKEDARAWTECGEFDSLGHKLQSKLASHIEDQLELLVDRIAHLLDAGWQSVRVVTDHGWLLVPSGLSKIPLPKYLATCRWSRCAIITDGAKVEVPQLGWFWDSLKPIAYAPGAGCFATGTEYAHGGLSLQECVIPDLIFTRATTAKNLSVSIESIIWLGLRCRVTITPAGAGLFAELRTKPNAPASKICETKSIDGEGRTGLLIEDESLAGTTVSLVIFDKAGRVLAKQPTNVGGDS